MVIVFDLDNTLVDEFGATVRPGIEPLLGRLAGEGHTLLLWTNSTRARAQEILKEHGLARHFSRRIDREDYDPDNLGRHKDIRKVRGDLLVDDDPEEIRHVRSIGRAGFLVTPYRRGRRPKPGELATLYRLVSGGRRRR